MYTKILLKMVVVLAVFSLMGSCSDKDDSRLAENARLKLYLTDAPGDYEAVNIDVQDVMINATDDTESGWESLSGVNSGVYDLLELTGGLNVLLADNELPAGKLKQVRLVLGADNTVVIDGESFPLDTPSAMQSGLKIQVNETLEAGYTYDIILDFDVDASVVEAGASGKRNLKPVIRASAIATSGIISGSVEPTGFQIKVSVMDGADEISAYTNEAGLFVLYGVPGGVYDLAVTPDPAAGYGAVVVENVEVVNGETTMLEAMVLEKLENVGNVAGIITNTGVNYSATVVVGEGESAVTVEAYYEENGVFVFYNLPVGTFTVVITPEEGSGLSAKEIVEVVVTDQETTDLGEITLE